MLAAPGTAWRRGRSPTSPLPPRAPPQPKPPAAKTEQSFPLETRPGTSLCSSLPPRPRRQESAFERALWLPPAAGSLGDAMVGTFWGGLDQGYLRPSLPPFPAGWGRGRGDRSGCFCCGALREGWATPFSSRRNRDAPLMETCILLDPEGKVGVRHQPRSRLSGKCGYCKTHSCWSGASLGSLGLARVGKARI